MLQESAIGKDRKSYSLKPFHCQPYSSRMFKTDKAAQQHSGDRHKADVERSANGGKTIETEARERTVPCALGLCGSGPAQRRHSLKP